MGISEVKFAKSGDVSLAYQSWGEGPNLVIVPPLVSNVELSWEHERFRRAREHLGNHVHVIEFDKRGVGLSDRFDTVPTLEERIEDIAAVMRAEGLERANLLGLSEGGLMSQLFAATHPERVERMILGNSAIGLSAIPELSAYGSDSADAGGAVAERMAAFQRIGETWGHDAQAFVDLFVPSQSDNPAFVRWCARFQRQSASPADYRRQFESVVHLDANHRLTDIQAPTLVTNTTGDRIIEPSCGRYLADRIPHARYVEFDGADHLSWAMPTWRELVDCWIEFLTGAAPPSQTERRFATVLFTDIVGSTTAAAQAGDAAWRTMMDSHDRIAWQTLDVHRGKIIKSTGDGLLATFESPSDAVRCTSELAAQLAGIGLTIRAGLHAGEVEVREDGDISGMAVNLAARVEQKADDGKLFVSSTVRDMLIGSNFDFTERGEYDLKGIDGTWRLYELSGTS